VGKKDSAVTRNRDDVQEFRLRPRKPSAQGDRRTYASAYRIIMHHARMSGVRRHRVVGFGGTKIHGRPHMQRCAVRIVYSKNTSKGQWRAHGRYIARDTATERGVGFNSAEESIDIANRLEDWQKARDERVWKLIVSPEFGERADLKRLTRDLMSEMEADLGLPLEWVAAAHFNTEHPHVHVALRGVGRTGDQVRLTRDYIREGHRHIAEHHCTRQLGLRTEFDAAEAQRREISRFRYTSLDRIIQRDAAPNRTTESSFFTVTKDASRAGVGPTISLAERRTAERLMFLSSMGLAESTGPKTWRVRRDFESVLRAMQRTADWQKILVAHGVPLSMRSYR